MKITNWGNFPQTESRVYSLRLVDDLKELVLGSESLIARGLGRCYGDSSLNSTIVSTLRMNRLESFDEKTGMISCEAGVSLEELLEILVPRGWFVPVTPGTKFITVGGAIASDVHGKNHHTVGSFCNHVTSFDLLCGDGVVRRCSRKEHSDLFWATCGGMGLTGIILRAEFGLLRIPSAYIHQETMKAANLDEVMRAFEENKEWTYSVAWIDSMARGAALGRSLLFLGEHASTDFLREHNVKGDVFAVPKKRKLGVPFFMPGFVLSSVSVKVFNALVYHSRRKGRSTQIIDYDTYFYPLDRIHHWNRIYGRRGFTQYQLVFPKEHSEKGLKRILEEAARFGSGSFLAVLKLFGKQEGMLSFPVEGYTLTLDFPISSGLFPFLETMDDIVLDHGGRLYLTKDCRMRSERFARMYPAKEQFRRVKTQSDPQNRFRSLQSERVGLS